MGASPLVESQPQTSLWSASGSSAKNAGSSAFSLIWVFQRRATGAVSPAPYTTGAVSFRRVASAFASEPGPASGPHSSTRLSSSFAAPSISSRSGGAAPQSAAHSSAPTSMYTTAARGWKPPGGLITGTPSARASSARRPPVVRAIRWAPAAVAASQQASASSVLPE